jgi:hypothetical protein
VSVREYYLDTIGMVSSIFVTYEGIVEHEENSKLYVEIVEHTWACTIKIVAVM